MKKVFLGCRLHLVHTKFFRIDFHLWSAPPTRLGAGSETPRSDQRFHNPSGPNYGINKSPLFGDYEKECKSMYVSFVCITNMQNIRKLQEGNMCCTWHFCTKLHGPADRGPEVPTPDRSPSFWAKNPDRLFRVISVFVGFKVFSEERKLRKYFFREENYISHLKKMSRKC